MGIDENKAVVRKWIELWNARGSDGVDEVFAEDFNDPQVAATSASPVTLESFKALLRKQVDAMGHAQFEEHEMIAEGDSVLVRWTARGIHRGTLWGMPPTDRPIAIEGVNIFRLRDGRIVERRSFVNPAGLLALR